jgi:cytochrome P450
VEKVTMQELSSGLVRLEDPDFYLEDREAVYPRLQTEAPAFYYQPLDIVVLSRHEDIKDAARTPETFSSARGLHLGELRLNPEEKAVYKTLFDPAGEQFAYADPPRHRELRSIASRAFAPKAIAYLGERIQEHVDKLIAQIDPGSGLDFVERVAAPLPITVAEALIGLPSGHGEQIRAWSDALENLKLIRGPENLEKEVATFTTMNDFFREQIAFKRDHPGEDLISHLLAAELDGKPLSEANLLIYCSTFLAAGSDTTRSLLAGMVHAFATHPDQWSKLRGDPSLADAAVEESLRWTTPARGFARTALHDTEIAGASLREGQRVYLLFDAANRDPEVFEDPWTFDIGREEPKRNLAFGYGIHQCIAAHLARLEARILLRSLAGTFEGVEVAGEPQPIRQVLRAGWHEMPVAFHR